ncbi:DUF3500 domain-containing protein [Streptomyces violaceoruber]
MADAARDVADRMAEAARAWLDSLDAGRRGAAAGPAPDPGTPGEAEGERTRWYYTPTDHGGLTLHQQRPAQQRLAMRLVASGLSDAGYVTVATVLGLENVLDHVEGFSVNWGRERTRDPGMYYLRVFGEPGGPRPWGWRFGGHHVSLNNLVVDGRVVATTPASWAPTPPPRPSWAARRCARWGRPRTWRANWSAPCAPRPPPARHCCPAPRTTSWRATAPASATA